MPLNKELVGKDYGTATYEVTAEAIAAYARATNDENQRYLGGDDVVATPVFPVVPSFEAFMTAAMDPELGADVMRLVHGQEEHILHKPVRPGDKLTITSQLESVETKDSGETFTVKGTHKNQDGELVAEIRGTMFIRGKRLKGSGETPEPDPQRETVYEETTMVDEDQTVRYAEASGDHNPIHVDENIAKMAGLPRTINHGMCTMAIATKGAVNGLADGDPTRVRRVSVRFSKPVFPGGQITTKFWLESGSDSGKFYGFETYNEKGDAVIKNGEVEITP
ncbi:MAG: MaoC family dehydratase N-terminal domain-containing protein [Actinobacteria bacterium]|nr:MaoC family dehydratase N-terminal domain-containing protein [Actinomycetota bacterium]